MSNDISSTKREDEGEDKQNEGVLSLRTIGEQLSNTVNACLSSSTMLSSSTSIPIKIGDQSFTIHISPTEKSNLPVPSEQLQLEQHEEARRETLDFESDEDSMKEEEHHGKRCRIWIDNDDSSTELSSAHVKNILKDTSDIVQNNSEIAKTFTVETFVSETFVSKLKMKWGVKFTWGKFGYGAMFNALPTKVAFLNSTALEDTAEEEVEKQDIKMTCDNDSTDGDRGHLSLNFGNDDITETEVENGSEQNLPANDFLTQIKSVAMQRWLYPDEIKAILNHDNPILSISTAPPASPPTSGQLFLYNRSVTSNYKIDGHQWIQKKNSYRIREDQYLHAF